MKSYSEPKIADVFLNDLFIAEKKGLPMPFISEVLKKKNIFYTPKIIRQVFELLKDQNLIELIPNKFASFKYQDKVGEVVIPSFEQGTLDDIIPLYKLSSEGLHFMSGKQKLDLTNESLVEKFISKIEQNKVLALIIVICGVVTGIITFYEKIAPYVKPVFHENQNEIISLPVPTAWIFAGYYVTEESTFVMGPYLKVIQTKRKEENDFPQIGDIIKIVDRERHLLICDFKSKGRSLELQPPWMQGVSDDDDDTGFILPIGANVQVMDVSSGKDPNKREMAVWVRVRGKN